MSEIKKEKLPTLALLASGGSHYASPIMDMEMAETVAKHLKSLPKEERRELVIDIRLSLKIRTLLRTTGFSEFPIRHLGDERTKEIVSSQKSVENYSFVSYSRLPESGLVICDQDLPKLKENIEQAKNKVSTEQSIHPSVQSFSPPIKNSELEQLKKPKINTLEQERVDNMTQVLSFFSRTGSLPLSLDSNPVQKADKAAGEHDGSSSGLTNNG